jgi:hypothetical protein
LAGGHLLVGWTLMLGVFFAVLGFGDRAAESGWAAERATGAIPTTRVTQDDPTAGIADFLGLEASEYGRLRSERHLSWDDRDLRMAVSQLNQRPYRVLPSETEGWVQRVEGTLQRLIRHRVPGEGEGETRELFECWIRSTPSPAQAVGSATPTDPTLTRVLTGDVPELWQQGRWEPLAAGSDRWRWPSPSGAAGSELGETSDPVGRPTVSALVFRLGEKRLVWGSNLEADSVGSDGGTDLKWAAEVLPTGLAKRLEWPESDSNLILALLGQQATAAPQEVTAQQLRHIAQCWGELGRQRFDLGLWSLLTSGQRRELQPQENEPFYQMLRAVGEPVSFESSEISVHDLIRQPQWSVGRSFRVQPVIKQVTRVPIQPGERGSQLGIPSYYLLHGVIDLPRPLRLKFAEGRQIDYQQRFPVVIATRQLPNGLAVGDDLRQWVDCEGVFFKLWGYQSLRSKEVGVTQWAPLLIAHRIETSGPPTRASSPWPIGGLLLIPLGASLVLLLGVGLRAAFSRPRSSRRPR